MNRNLLIAVILLVVGSVVLVSLSKDVSKYATFNQADNGQEVKIAGTLAKDKPMVYEPETNHNEFSFFIKDSEGKERQVILNKPKPQDFELSEQIVVTGQMKDEVFYASEILMKCPSKYKDEEIAIKESNG